MVRQAHAAWAGNHLTQSGLAEWEALVRRAESPALPPDALEGLLVAQSATIGKISMAEALARMPNKEEIAGGAA